jgi:hypothetical protein
LFVFYFFHCFAPVLLRLNKIRMYALLALIIFDCSWMTIAAVEHLLL